MSRLSTIRRRLLLAAGYVIVLSGLSLIVVHTGLVRRFALVQLQTRLGNTTGLMIAAKSLDYNLLTSRFELHDIGIRDVHTADMNVPLKAQRVVAVVPLWRLLHGSLETARIQIDGLSLDVRTDATGRTNWPSFGSNDAKRTVGPFLGPAVLVTAGFINLQDERSGYRLAMPIGRLSGDRNPADPAYRILCESRGGVFQWNQAQFPLDSLQARAALVNGGLVLDSLHLASGESQMEVNGSINGSPSRIDAAATLGLNLREVSGMLHLTKPAQGQVEARLSAQGLLQTMRIHASMQGDPLVVGGIPVRNLLADALFDTATGEVEIRKLSAGLLAGQLTGRGRLSLTSQGRSDLTAGLSNFSLQQAARAAGSSSAPGGRASLDLHASAPGLDWSRAAVSGTARVKSSKVAFRADGNGGSVRASLDSTLGDAANIRGDVAVRLADGSVSGTLNGRTDSLAKLSREMENLLDLTPGSLTSADADGSATWSASLGGTTRVPSASVELQANGLSTGSLTGGDLQLRAEYAHDRIGIESARLAWAGQKAEMKGEIGALTSEPSLQLDGTVQGESLAEVFQQLGVTPSAEAAVSAQFRVSGTISNPTAEVTVRADRLAVFSRPFPTASVNARWQDSTLVVSELSAVQEDKSGAPGRIEANGRVNFATREFEIEADAQDFRPASGAAGDVPVSGTFQWQAHGKGSLDDPSVTAEITGDGVKIGQLALGDVRVKLDAAGHRATVDLTLPALNAKATSTIGMEGKFPFEVILDAQKTRIATDPPVSFDVAARASGTLAEPAIQTASAKVENLRLTAAGHDIVSDGPIDLSYGNGRIHIGQLALKSGNSNLTVAGQMPVEESEAPGSLAVKGSIDLAPLSKLLPGSSVSTIGGTVDVNASISGAVRNWQPSGGLTIREGSLHSQSIPFPLDGIAGTVDLQNGAIRLNQLAGKAGTGTFRLDASVPLSLIAPDMPVPAVSKGQPARLSAQLEKMELIGGNSEHPATISFGAKVESEASALTLAALRATVELTGLDAKAQSSDLKQASPTRITIADNVARLEQLDLRGTGSSLKASGSLGLTGEQPVELEASGETDIAILSALSPSLETSGTLRLGVRMAGTLSDPQTTGTIELEQANVALSTPPLQARNMRLSAALAGDSISLKEFRGNLNGGAFEGGGSLKFGAGGLHDVNLFLKGKDTFMDYPFSIKTTSNVDAKLVSRGSQLMLEGHVDVEEGFYESAMDLFSKSGGRVDIGFEELPQGPSNPVRLDIKIVTRRPVEMDNNLGRLSATADLRLGGSVAQPRLVGSMELEEDGRLYFGDRTYYIERGTVRFLDEPRITPELNIQAYTRTGDYTIKLGLTGQLDEVTTSFTSDPPLSRDDVIAVLLTGKTVAENRGVDLRALEATSLATGALNASLSSQLHRSVGVSRVSIQPAAVAAESNPGARVTITQDFTQSFRLLYSMNLSDSNDQIWVGEYDLSRRFTTRAVKQSDNSYRGEFRHDIRFGSSSPATKTAVAAIRQRITALRFTGNGPFSPEQLAKTFKVKAGQQYKPIKVRKGAERVRNLLAKQGYLESRVRLDRQNTDQGLDLTVRLGLGPTVQMTFQGADLPGGEKKRVRAIWSAGISDQQRPQTSKAAILGYLADKGFLRAEADCQVTGDAGKKDVRFDIKPGIKYHDVKIVVEGAEPYRARDILSLIGKGPLRQSVYRDPARAIEAINGFYRQRGYLAAKVAPPIHQLDAGRQTGQIVIPVKEGPAYQVGVVQFNGNQALTASDLQAGLPLEGGEVFEPARLEPSLAALKLKYGKQGYRDAHIEYAVARHDDRAAVDVSFTVEENQQTTIGSVKVEGNRHTSEKFALRQLRVGEGQVADTQAVRESVKNLSQTGAYTTADIEVRPISQAVSGQNPVQVAELVVGVAEPKPFRLLYGGLYDTDNGPGFIADLQAYNLLGAGRVLGLRARADGQTDEFRLYLTQPTLRTRRLSTTLATYYTRETEDYQTTPTEKLGVSIQQDTQLRSKLLLSYGYRYEKQRGFIPDPAAPPIPESIVTVSPATITLTREARDNYLDATRGSFMSHGFELAPKFLGSDYPYLRYYLQYFKYFSLTRPRAVPFGEKPLRSRLVFATGTRAGMQKGFNSTGAVLTDRFYAGGGTTVRGFRQDELGPRLANGQPAGGNAVLVLNEEIRYPLFWVFDAVTFVDIGNVFPRVGDFRFKDLRSAGGFGLRIRNPFVVLRFDYGFKFHRRPGESIGAFFFSIGQAF